MRRAVDRGRDAWAVSLNAFAALLVSPISWSHHWVWGETAMLALGCLALREPAGARRRCLLVLAATGTALLAAAPQWWLPSGGDRELHWAVWEQLAGSGYVLLAVAALAVSAAGTRRAAREVAVGPVTGDVFAVSPSLAWHETVAVIAGARRAGR
jgi:alpha-1,2-mannosyltransferase